MKHSEVKYLSLQRQ